MSLELQASVPGVVSVFWGSVSAFGAWGSISVFGFQC